MTLRLNGSTSGYVELDSPAVGNNVTITLPNTASTLANTSQVGVGKNRLINSDFSVWQRGTPGAMGGAGSMFTADRWLVGRDGAQTVTASQQSFTAGAAPVSGYESQFFLRVGVSSSGGANSWIAQRVEDVRSLAGQTATLSFWAKASTAITIKTAILQNFGSGGSGDVVTYGSDLNITTSWARYSTQITVPSVSGKTIGASSYLGVYPFLFTSNLTSFDIWGVQFEAGSAATPFEVEPFSETLRKCQRYYEKSYSTSVNPGTNTAEGVISFYGATDTAGYVLWMQEFKVPKRTVPTITAYTVDGTVDRWTYSRSGVSATAVLPSIDGIGTQRFRIYIATGAGNVAAQLVGHWTASAEL